MKNVLILLVLTTLTSLVQAQKFFYVDTEYILENSDEYIKAMEEINALSERWQQTIEAKYQKIDELKKNYEAEKILLTSDMRAKREAEIEKREGEARKYQKEKFGVNGQLFKKRQDAIKPIQDKIYDEIRKIATNGNFAVVFDRSSGGNVLYASPRFDKTELVMQKLGYKKSKE